MLGAHLGAVAPDVGAPPSTWTGVVNGRSSILFAVLAGTSVALLSGRTAPVTADPLPRTVFPLAAVGSMALTAYAGGIVAVAVTGTLDYTTRRHLDERHESRWVAGFTPVDRRLAQPHGVRRGRRKAGDRTPRPSAPSAALDSPARYPWIPRDAGSGN
jgi:hypothetical protein